MASDPVSAAFTALVSQDNSNKLTWILANFENNEPVLVAQSEEGFAELKKALDPSKIQHGVFKVLGVDDRGNVVATRPKIVSFVYVGHGVGALKRGQAGPQKDKLKKVFLGVHLEIQIDDLDDFTQVSVAQKLLASGGAHKPTHYDFGSNDIVTVESLIGQKHT